MSENKSRDLAFIEYTNKTIFPESVNRLDFNGGYDSRDKEVEDLKGIIKSSIVFQENNADCDGECMELHENDETCRHDDFIFKAREAIK